jgi:hypothetical protein
MIMVITRSQVFSSSPDKFSKSNQTSEKGKQYLFTSDEKLAQIVANLKFFSMSLWMPRPPAAARSSSGPAQAPPGPNSLGFQLIAIRSLHHIPHQMRPRKHSPQPGSEGSLLSHQSPCRTEIHLVTYS